MLYVWASYLRVIENRNNFHVLPFCIPHLRNFVTWNGIYFQESFLAYRKPSRTMNFLTFFSWLFPILCLLSYPTYLYCFVRCTILKNMSILRFSYSPSCIFGIAYDCLNYLSPCRHLTLFRHISLFLHNFGIFWPFLLHWMILSWSYIE